MDNYYHKLSYNGSSKNPFIIPEEIYLVFFPIEAIISPQFFPQFCKVCKPLII